MADAYNFYSDVGAIRGIGPKKKERLEHMGIRTVYELLAHYPVRYRDRRHPVPSTSVLENKDVLVQGILLKKNQRRLSGRKSIVECVLKDASGTFSAVFFNMPYIMNSLNIGTEYTVFGRMKRRNGLAVWTNPEIAELNSASDIRGIIPVYRCTQGITSRELGKYCSLALNAADSDCEWLSEELIEDNKLCSREFALRNIHFPSDEQAYKYARFRLSYDELLAYQIAVRRSRLEQEDRSRDASLDDCDINPFIENLPFELTEGQRSAIDDIEKDLTDCRPMNRLVQGDVGCGKTVVAEAAIYKTVSAGMQAAFMAPTEILAKQHFVKLSSDFEQYGFRVCLMTSGMKAAERREILAGLASGDIDIAVGTHALLTEDVEYSKLALVITDGQHRFGVNQRKTLVNKGRAVNVLVMSATPIPRTLGATVFGDMDFSIIRSKPADRLPIITKALDPASRARAYASAKAEMDKGHSVYVVAPSIDSEDDDITSVEKLYEELKGRFKSYSCGLIHGRMSKDEKERIMHSFAVGDIQMLVATVVIEVGIDVPSASVIIIENSERFGLAQLHQLRGRVGRSELQSYCFLINYSRSQSAIDRANAMVRLQDGFEISEEDYRLRGPGDLMGTMQHGTYQNRILSLCRNEKMLDAAVRDADRILSGEVYADMAEVARRIVSVNQTDNSEII